MVSGATHSLAGPQTAGIIGKAQAAGPIGGRRQTSTVDPGKVPASAIEVAGGIAYGVVDNRLPVKAGEQILPVGITVGVTVSGSAIGRGQDIARTGGHGIQTAVGRIVSIPLGIGRTAQLPVLSRQLVILIVALAGPQNGIAVLLSLTVDQSANGIVGVQVGGDAAAIGFCQAVEPPLTVVDIGQDPAIIVGSRFRPPQVIMTTSPLP